MGESGLAWSGNGLLDLVWFADYGGVWADSALRGDFEVPCAPGGFSVVPGGFVGWVCFDA